MALKHVTVFRWKAGITPEQVQAVADGLRALPGQIPELRRYDIGPDLGLREGNGDFAVVAEVDDEEAWRRYVQHPAHVRVLEDHIVPAVESRTSCQFRV